MNTYIYDKVKTPPMDCLKKIEGGKLNGKTNVDPQWRIEIMTNVFGPCGVGWCFRVVDIKEEQCPSGEKMVYMQISLQVKSPEGEWSEPIYAWGGDFILEKNKNGLVPNDEAYKMCLTDALGNAMRYLGVAADVYQGKFDNKYGRGGNRANSAQEPPKGTPANKPSSETKQTAGEPYTKHEKGYLWVKSLKDGSWLPVNDMTIGQMKWAANCAKYADAKAEIAMLGAEKFGAEWNK